MCVHGLRGLSSPTMQGRAGSWQWRHMPSSRDQTMTQLTDTQLILLSAASQRDNRLIPLPDRLRGAALDTLSAKLIALGLATKSEVGPADPIWWRDADDTAIGMTITADGFRSLGIDPEGHEALPPAEAVVPLKVAASPGSKIAAVVTLLRRPEGASIEVVMTATGWLPHSCRAAFTGLRKRGHNVERVRDAARQSVYRITTGEGC